MPTSPSYDWLSPLADDSLGDFALNARIDADLSRRALLARSDRAQRDALFGLLAFKINRFCSRFRRWNLLPWEIDDVRQEAYLAFIDVVNGWLPLSGAGAPAGFSFYFMRVYPLRLTDRVRRVVRTRRDRLPPASWRETDDDRRDPVEMERDVETLAFIIEMSARLDAADARILLLRTADDLAPDEVAVRSGISRRTFYRRWKEIAATIRREAG